MSKIKKNPLLDEIAEAINGRIPRCEVEVLGHRYALEVLIPEGEDWVTVNTPGGTLSAALANVRAPTVAAALRSIDDASVESLFQPGDDVDAKFREALMTRIDLMRDWRRAQVLEWLREKGETFVIDQLYHAYGTMVEKHQTALKEMDSFSKRTPSQA